MTETQRDKGQLDLPSDPFSLERKKLLESIELEFSFLITFIDYTAPRCYDYQNLGDLLMQAEALYQRLPEHQKSLDDLNKEGMWTESYTMGADILDELKLVNSEIIQVHRIMSRSSSFHYGESDHVEFIETLLENLQQLMEFKNDLVYPLTKELNDLENQLMFLRALLVLTTERCTEHEKLSDLFGHVEVVAESAVYLTYSCLVDGMDEGKLDKLVYDLSALVRMIDPVTSPVRQIYIRVLKAASGPSSSSSGPSSLPELSSSSSETYSDEIEADFVHSLLGENMDFSRQASVGHTDPIEDQIVILQEELRFLVEILMIPPWKYYDTLTLSGLLEHVILISIKAGIVIYSLYDNERNEEIAENALSLLVYLLEEIKFLKIDFHLKMRETQEDRRRVTSVTHVKSSAGNVQHLSHSCVVDDMDEDMLENLGFDRSDLVQKIDSASPEVRQVYLRVLKICSGSSRADSYTSEKDQIGVELVVYLLKKVMELLCAGLTVPKIELLRAELEFLRNTPNIINKTQINDCLKQAEGEAGSDHGSLISEETPEEMSYLMLDLLEEIKLFKEQTYLKPQFPKLSRTDELGFFYGFLGNLEELLSNKIDCITCLNLPVEPLIQELQFLGSFLTKIAKLHAKQEELKLLWDQILEVAYTAEYIIDSL